MNFFFDPNLRESLWDSLDIAKEQFAYGMQFCDVLTFANSAASIITTRKGALKVMPSVDEIKELIDPAK